MKLYQYFFVIGLFFSGNLCFAASFDCAKASTPLEKTICSNPNLSNLDIQLSSAYKEARAKSNDSEALKKQQVEWIKETRSCGSDVGCIERAYKSRIIQLQKSPEVSSASQTKAGALTDQDIYKFYIRCYGPINLAFIIEQQNSKNDQTFSKLKASYQLAAEDIGKKLGYSSTKVKNDLSKSEDVYLQPHLEINHKNNPTVVQANIKKHNEELSSCVNQTKDNKNFGTLVYKYYNSMK